MIQTIVGIVLWKFRRVIVPCASVHECAPCSTLSFISVCTSYLWTGSSMLFYGARHGQANLATSSQWLVFANAEKVDCIAYFVVHEANSMLTGEG